MQESQGSIDYQAALFMEICSISKREATKRAHFKTLIHPWSNVRLNIAIQGRNVDVLH
ncbi:hypothetical protein HYV10_02540 [Candidatus Dependentiae bacterium]|nr:hypothetical protein [Candidatus Dependentiae bacterium]